MLIRIPTSTQSAHTQDVEPFEHPLEFGLNGSKAGRDPLHSRVARSAMLSASPQHPVQHVMNRRGDNLGRVIQAFKGHQQLSIDPDAIPELLILQSGGSQMISWKNPIASFSNTMKQAKTAPRTHGGPSI